MRQLCHHIHLVVSSKFADSVYTAIGGWIFLRYINPSIISPDIVDVEVPGESKEVRRALLLVTKVGLCILIKDDEPALKQPV